MSVLRTAGLVSVLVGGIFWLITTLIALSRKDTIAGIVHGALGIIILVLSIVFIDTVGLPLPIVLLVIELTSFRIISEYARGVIFRFGRMHGVLGPGVSVILPLGIDQVKVVDVRTFTIDVPRQEIITRDNVPVVVDAVVYFNIFDPVLAVTKVANYVASTSLLGQTILRSVLGQHELDDILAKRAELNEILRKLLDEATDPWGVKVTMVEIKSIELPDTMKRAMARQAEAERDRRAKVIAAEGELQASQRLAEAAQVMSSQPVALQLRYLQTLSEIATEQNSTIVFPLPVELLKLIDRSKERD